MIVLRHFFLSSMANKNSTLRCTFSALSHSATLLQGLSVLRAQGQLLDVVLAINEERFQVHKAVLAACSDYFRLVATTRLLILKWKALS